MQAAARYCYNKAESIELVNILILILLPVLKIFFPNSKFLTLILILWFFASQFLNLLVSKKIEQGAGLKAEFDQYVYGWSENISNKLIHDSKILKTDHLKLFERLLSHTGTDKIAGVKDWYDFDHSINSKIKSAQQENIFFDKKVQIDMPVIIFSFIVIITVCLLFWNHIEVSDLLATAFVTFASLSSKVISLCFSLWNVNKLNQEAQHLIYDSTEEFEVQRIINQIRRINTLSFNFIYKIKRIALHKSFKNYNE